MKILLWHGYLLTGSGSNIYTANLARAWRDQGHEVLLLCQEHDVGALGFVDEVGDFAPDNRRFEARATTAPRGSGRVTLLRPAIGDVLPVYVLDEYVGFTAKLYVDLTDDELRAYVDANVGALTTAIRAFAPDAIVTGHEVMGPHIARRACERTSTSYVAKLHGSALEYAVKVQERYRRYARDGLCGARAITGGSRYMIDAAAAVVPGWEDRAVVVNPGCDVELFRPRQRPGDGPPVAGYVGKLIAPKGVHNFLAALGLTTAPGLRAVVVGFGDLEPRLRALQEALARGDVEAARAALGDDRRLADVAGFVGAQAGSSAYWERSAAVAVEWTGRLDHGPLSRRLPGFDALAVPSVAPEAFGMVAAEGAACGVLPVVPRHSGIGEVGVALEEALGRPGLLTYDPGAPIDGLGRALDRILRMPAGERHALGAAAAEVARSRWSWRGVAERLLEVATGVAARRS